MLSLEVGLRLLEAEKTGLVEKWAEIGKALVRGQSKVTPKFFKKYIWQRLCLEHVVSLIYDIDGEIEPLTETIWKALLLAIVCQGDKDLLQMSIAKQIDIDLNAFREGVSEYFANDQLLIDVVTLTYFPQRAYLQTIYESSAGMQYFRKIKSDEYFHTTYNRQAKELDEIVAIAKVLHIVAGKRRHDKTLHISLELCASVVQTVMRDDNIKWRELNPGEDIRLAPRTKGHRTLMRRWQYGRQMLPLIYAASSIKTPTGTLLDDIKLERQVTLERMKECIRRARYVAEDVLSALSKQDAAHNAQKDFHSVPSQEFSITIAKGSLEDALNQMLTKKRLTTHRVN